MKYNFELFQVNDSVRIDEKQLEILKRDQKYIENMNPDFSQFEDLNAPMRIRSVYGYHGGSIVYEFTGISGVWPECILIDYMLTDKDIPEEMRCLASEFYNIEVLNESNLNYISIKNHQGLQVVKILTREKKDIDFILKAASLKSRFGFDAMFNVFW